MESLENPIEHVVSGNNYTSEVRVLGPDFIHFKRIHRRTEFSLETDAFSSVWTVAIGEAGPGEFCAQRMGQKFEFDGWWAFLIPPFSLVEWHINANRLEWDGYLMTGEFPADLPDFPLAFPVDKREAFSERQDLLEFLMSQDYSDAIRLDKMEKSSPIAIEAKKLIDREFKETLSISEISKMLGHTHSVVSRAFKNAYGISPIAYRNKLRVFESTRLLMFEGKDVTTSGFEVGFSDLGRFHKQFSRQNNARPSRFRINRE